MKTTFLCVFLASLLAVMGCVTNDTASPKEAQAELYNAAGEMVAAADLTETDGGVRIQLFVSDLPPGQYAFQIHEFGRCTPPTFLSAGSVYPPPEDVAMTSNVSPAIPRSLGEFNVGEIGGAQSEVIAPVVTLGSGSNSLFHEGGTALVIHATAPTGTPTERVACGTISLSEVHTQELPEGGLESGKTPDNLGAPGRTYQQTQEPAERP